MSKGQIFLGRLILYILVVGAIIRNIQQDDKIDAIRQQCVMKEQTP